MLCCAIIALFAAAAAVPLRILARWRLARKFEASAIAETRACAHHPPPAGEVPTAA